MKRLTPEEIADLKKHLVEWQTPQAMHSLVEATMSSLGSTNLFNQGGLAFLRDAWIASEFGSQRNAEKVRLVPDNWPDFELQASGHLEAFEAVEADDPARRRGLEYRQGIDEVEDDPVEDWIARAAQAPTWLEAACQKKAGKRYSERANLVILLNLSEYGIRQAEVEGCLKSATKTVKSAFETVWVLWKKRSYRVWP